MKKNLALSAILAIALCFVSTAMAQEDVKLLDMNEGFALTGQIPGAIQDGTVATVEIIYNDITWTGSAPLNWGRIGQVIMTNGTYPTGVITDPGKLALKGDLPEATWNLWPRTLEVTVPNFGTFTA